MRVVLVVLVLLVGAGALLAGRVLEGGLPALGPAAAPTSVPPPDVAPRAKPDPQKGEVVLEVTEAELSRQLSQQLVGRSLGETPLGSASLERLEAALRGGRAELTGSARLGGTSVPISSSLTAQPDPNGRVRVSVADAKAGGFPLPESARAELESTAQRELDRLLARQPMRVRSIEIGDGRLRAIGAPGA